MVDSLLPAHFQAMPRDGVRLETFGLDFPGDFLPKSIPKVPPAGYLKAVGLKMFGPVFPGFMAGDRPRDPPRSTGARPAHQFAPKISPGDQF